MLGHPRPLLEAPWTASYRTQLYLIVTTPSMTEGGPELKFEPEARSWNGLALVLLHIGLRSAKISPNGLFCCAPYQTVEYNDSIYVLLYQPSLRSRAFQDGKLKDTGNECWRPNVNKFNSLRMSTSNGTRSFTARGTSTLRLLLKATTHTDNRRLDHDERVRKRRAREGHKASSDAQKLIGLRAKLHQKKRHNEKIQMKKQIKAHEERNVKSSAPSEPSSQPLPQYLLDRSEATNAKALSSAIKNKRAEKAAKFSVPLPKVKGISEAEMFSVVKTGKKTQKKGWKRMITKPTFVGQDFTRRPVKYERFIRPMGLRYKKAHVTHPELGKCCFSSFSKEKRLWQNQDTKTRSRRDRAITNHFSQKEPAEPNVHSTWRPNERHHHRSQRQRARYGNGRRESGMGTMGADHKQL